MDAFVAFAEIYKAGEISVGEPEGEMATLPSRHWTLGSLSKDGNPPMFVQWSVCSRLRPYAGRLGRGKLGIRAIEQSTL